MRYGIITIIVSALLATATYAQPNTEIFPTFAPENDLYIGPNEKTRTLVTEDDFNWIADTLGELYRPIFEASGGKLIIKANWDDGKVNAYTKRSTAGWEVHLFGGLARVDDMTVEGFASVVCHEFGHQIGGLPKKTSWFSKASWPAAEGQSDYFATSKCLKRLLVGQPNIEIVKTIDVPATVAEQCSEVYDYEEDQAICIRSALAGEALGKVLASLTGSDAPSVETPSTVVVSKTNTGGYPSAQCRVDTYFQGALCDQPYSIKPSNKDIHQGYCARVNGYSHGARPLCWFAPSK